jgi:hypothetical protein
LTAVSQSMKSFSNCAWYNEISSSSSKSCSISTWTDSSSGGPYGPLLYQGISPRHHAGGVWGAGEDRALVGGAPVIDTALQAP